MLTETCIRMYAYMHLYIACVVNAYIAFCMSTPNVVSWQLFIFLNLGPLTEVLVYIDKICIFFYIYTYETSINWVLDVPSISS